MKLALHRSVTFWSGLLVMGFICWAWLRSLHYLDGVFYHTSRVIVTAGQVASRLELTLDHSFPPMPVSIMQVYHEPASTAQEPLLPRPVVLEIYDRQYQLTIAHWLLLLAVALPWLALLLWRALRRKRAAGP